MTLAKKSAKKKLVSKAAPQKKTIEKGIEHLFRMPTEVSEWIERANSTIQHLRGKVERLESENKELKAYQKFAEQRILRSEHE
jgi:hypothetical protein